MATPITTFRSVRITPGNLYVGEGDPDTALNGGDVHITGTLEVDGALNIDGAWSLGNTLTVGEDDTGYDVKFFGATSGAYLLWDESADALLLVGAAATMAMGSLASVAGSGTALSATKSGALKVFADDGGAAIGSGVLTRAIEGRNLQTYTAGNREQEAAGVIGKLVSVAGTNRHNMCGILGSYEVQTSVTVGGQTPATDTWCQAAVIGRVGVGTAITTIDSNGRLAGVAAMSNTTSFAANNGVYAGFYASRWGSTIPFEYGIYCEKVAHGAYFDVDAGVVSGEEHGWDLVNTGTLSSGDSLVGVNVVTTSLGSAASWVSGMYVKATQASKTVNGYICAAEFELTSVAVNASDHAAIVLNMTNNHTGSVPVSPYILLRDYGTTHANCFIRIYGDTGQSGATDATTLITTVSDGYEANCNYAIRCMLGSTPVWLLATTTAAS